MELNACSELKGRRLEFVVALSEQLVRYWLWPQEHGLGKIT